MISLVKLLDYENEAVKSRFILRYPEQKNNVDVLFKDMLRYLWMSEKHHKDCILNANDQTLKFRNVMHVEMRLIDEVWHDFILMTRDYHEFCHHYFGHFIHHQVNQRDQLDEEASEINEEIFAEETERFFSYIYDNLGEETLIRWFRPHFERT